MLDTLKSDPASRLVQPKFISQNPFPQKDLQEIKKASAIFIPSVHSHLLLDIQGLPDPVNAVPALENDPFVVKSDPTFAEGKKWVVLSESLHRKIRKEKGETLTILLRRTATAGQPEEVKFESLIAGVVPSVNMPKEEVKLFLPLNVFNSFSHWRKGYAAPDLNLAGNRSHMLTPEYDGVLTDLALTRPTDEEYRRMIAGRLPFATIPTVWKKEGWSSKLGKEQALWHTVNSTIDEKDVQALVNRYLDLGYSPQTVPYVADLYLECDSAGSPKNWKLTILPDANSPPWQQEELPTLLIPQEDKGFEGKTSVILRTGLESNPVKIPVLLTTSEYVEPGYVAANSKLAGLMHSAKRLGAVYNISSRSFLLNFESQIHYFRAYADSIDTLEQLVELVAEKGKTLDSRALEEPVSRIGDVRRIRTLSNYMKKIYLLIAIISGISTIFAVAASVYATVQRRRYDLAYLNMLGVARITIVFFPFIKSLLLISCGIIVAFAAYFFFGYLSSQWFIELLGPTESLTRLEPKYIAILIGVIGFLGGFISMLAASCVGRMESNRCVHEKM